MSLTNNYKKYIKSLHLRKHKVRHKKYILEGSKSCIELISGIPAYVDHVICSEQWAESNQHLLSSHQVDVIKEKEVLALSQSNQKDVIVIFESDFKVNSDYNKKISIFLDDVQDPGNVGTIIRTSDWYAVPEVILSPGSAQMSNQKVLQSTMGGFIRVSCPTLSWDQVKEKYPDRQYIGTAMQGSTHGTSLKADDIVLVIGNEGKGISDKVKSDCTHLVHIPGEGKAESLNASVSAAIILSQIIDS